MWAFLKRGAHIFSKIHLVSIFMRYFIKSRLKMMAKYVILCMGNCFLLCVCVVFLFHRTENRGECRIGILPEGRWA